MATASIEPGGRVVVVGAGLAGLRAAEHLVRSGHRGETLVLGAEHRAPYNRPPLSKQALLEGYDEAALPLRSTVEGLDVRTGVEVLGVSADLSTLRLSDGSSVHADALVVASGVRPRRLVDPRVGALPLRTPEDAAAVRGRLVPGARVVVVGAGFLGCEIASAARARGCQVDVVDPFEAPLTVAAGVEVGRELQRRHERDGVRFRLGTTVAGPDGPGALVLSDGTRLPFDVVVEAVGCVPDVGWLQGSGLDTSDGVLCDATLRAVHPDPGVRVVAAGDCARFPLPAFGPTPRRIEHWNLAVDTARRAAETLLGLLEGRDPHPADPIVPSFWSDQAGTRVDCFGVVAPGLDDVRVLEGRPGDDDGVAFGYYAPDGRLSAVALVGLRRRVPHYRQVVTAAARELIPG